MDRDDAVRLAKGAFRNAVLWGAGLFAATLALVVGAGVIGVGPEPFPWLDGIGLALRAGFIGSVTGAAFATVIRVVYHGRRLSELSWVRFGITGAVAAGVFVPLFLQTMNLVSGDGLVPWSLVLDDGALMAVFGGVAAAASLKLAQVSERFLPDRRRAELTEGRGLGPIDVGIRQEPEHVAESKSRS